MRPFLIWMALVNVALAALSGYFVARMPFLFDVGGGSAGEAVPQPMIPFWAVVAFPVFCLGAAALPLILLGRGATRGASILSLLPGLVALVVVLLT